MIGKLKQFNPELYKLYDESAKQAVCRWLARRGHEVYIPDENYGADLYHTDGTGRQVWHEVEISKAYWGKPTDDSFFALAETSIPERKIRLVNNPEYRYLLHWLINPSRTKAIVTNMKKYMLPKYLKPVQNKYIKEGEYFYRIPLQLCKKVDLTK